MNGLQFFYTLRSLVGMVLLVGCFLLAMGFEIHDELSLQSNYRARFGQSWKEHYQEEQHCSVADGNRKIGVAAGGLTVVPLILFGIYRQIVPKGRNGHSRHSRRRRSRGQMLSPTEEPRESPVLLAREHHRSRRVSRGARHRRNAAIAIPAGFLVILAGVVLSLFRCGIFADHSNEFALGIIVFFAGYFTIIFGCWSWAMAKHLNDALVMIGLVPLLPLLIPYVRLSIFLAPQLFALAMIVSPLILILTIASLPSQR